MRRFLTLLSLLILSLPTYYILLKPGYFSMHDDLQVMRIYQMEKCLADGQIPCRWSQDLAYGYGQAMFNFYSVFPYYLGALVRIATPLSIIDTVKFLFLVTQIASMIGMYILAKNFWGRLGGILSALLFAYGPYHAVDTFVRGALSESFALAIFPFIWLSIYLLTEKQNYWRVLGLSFGLTVLFTTHNISSLIFAPFTLAWGFYWFWIKKSLRFLYSLLASLLLALGLSAFFLVPNLAEQSLIQKSFLTEDYFFYGAHFVSLKQLFFERDWGYGPSIFGPDDEISFQIGWPYWWLGFLLFILGLSWLRSKNFDKKSLAFILLGLLFFSGLTSFLTHLRSNFIWLNVGLLSYVQFPWRFLGLTIFFLSLAGGALAKIGFGFGKLIIVLLIPLTIILNARYFKPQYYWWWASDEEKLSGEAFVIQQKAAILDYLPNWVKVAPKEPASTSPRIIKGNGIISNFSKRSNNFFFDAEIFEESEISIPIIYYPGWKVIKEGKVMESQPSGDYGLITVNLPRGKQMISGRFEDEGVRSLSNFISLVSVMLILGGVVVKSQKGRFLGL